MDDKEHVLDAYGQLVEQIFNTFFASYTGAHGNAGEESAAEERFRNGILHARYVRDRALALLP